MADLESASLLRDDDGAVVAVFKGEAAPPLSWNNGFLVDAENRLVIAPKGA